MTAIFHMGSEIRRKCLISFDNQQYKVRKNTGLTIWRDSDLAGEPLWADQ
jgi:hypothetical protein